MHLTYRNVNDAFSGLVRGFYTRGKDGFCQFSNSSIVEKPSRNGPVLMIEEPVIVTYTQPRERVLFNAARDANPFFHLYESLWMLAGRNDVAPLAYYNSQIKNYSDDEKTFNGAYGYRWRYQGYRCTAKDQIRHIIAHLKAKPDSRRAVLQMWTSEDDLSKIDTSKDVCCNLSAMFSIRQVQVAAMSCVSGGTEPLIRSYLDMTVTNRSNDLIWGMLGANVVHFSILQEYMAAHLGCEVGVYNQISNNLHVYTEKFEPEKWLAAPIQDYRGPPMASTLVRNPEVFDKEVGEFVEFHKGPEEPTCKKTWREPFLSNAASPMLRAFHRYKTKDWLSAMSWVDRIAADDWRQAAGDWIKRRMEKSHATGTDQA